VIATIGGAVPVFLVPEPTLDLGSLFPSVEVRYTWDKDGWYISSAHRNKLLFSFDLPFEVVRLYAASGNLTQPAALDLKEQMLSNVQAVAVVQGRTQILHMDLDRHWLADVRAQAGRPTL
jgi:hypothetical protein